MPVPSGPITEAEFAAAEQRSRVLRSSCPRVVTARRDGPAIVVTFAIGMSLHVPIAIIQDLAERPDDPRVDRILVTAGGLALRWPDLDVDLFVPPLLQGITGTRAWQNKLLTRNEPSLG